MLQIYLTFRKIFVIITLSIVRKEVEYVIKIAVCNSTQDETIMLRDTIRDYLINHKIVVKMVTFDTLEDLMATLEKFDIYLIDDNDAMDSIISYHKVIKEYAPDSRIIYMSDTPAAAYTAVKLHADGYLLKPIDIEDLKETIEFLIKTIRMEHVILRTSTGSRRVKTVDLNYVNIVKRCMCYHLADGSMFDSQTLRQSFAKALGPLTQHPMFIFVSPASLINMANVKEVKEDHVVFENLESTSYPVRLHDEIMKLWRYWHNAYN